MFRKLFIALAAAATAGLALGHPAQAHHTPAHTLQQSAGPTAGPPIDPGSIPIQVANSYIGDVQVERHGTFVRVSWKTTILSKNSFAELWHGETLVQSTQLSYNPYVPKKAWYETLAGLQPATAYVLKIKVWVPHVPIDVTKPKLGKGGDWAVYVHPTAVTTLTRVVKVTLGTLTMLDDSDDGCGELMFDLAAGAQLERRFAVVCDGMPGWTPWIELKPGDSVATPLTFTLENVADDYVSVKILGVDYDDFDPCDVPWVVCLDPWPSCQPGYGGCKGFGDEGEKVLSLYVGPYANGSKEEKEVVQTVHVPGPPTFDVWMKYSVSYF
jgi:hypothetical protein